MGWLAQTWSQIWITRDTCLHRGVSRILLLILFVVVVVFGFQASAVKLLSLFGKFSTLWVLVRGSSCFHCTNNSRYSIHCLSASPPCGRLSGPLGWATSARVQGVEWETSVRRRAWQRVLPRDPSVGSVPGLSLQCAVPSGSARQAGTLTFPLACVSGVSAITWLLFFVWL